MQENSNMSFDKTAIGITNSLKYYFDFVYIAGHQLLESQHGLLLGRLFLIGLKLLEYASHGVQLNLQSLYFNYAFDSLRLEIRTLDDLI